MRVVVGPGLHITGYIIGKVLIPLLRIGKNNNHFRNFSKFEPNFRVCCITHDLLYLRSILDRVGHASPFYYSMQVDGYHRYKHLLNS